MQHLGCSEAWLPGALKRFWAQGDCYLPDPEVERGLVTAVVVGGRGDGGKGRGAPAKGRTPNSKSSSKFYFVRFGCCFGVTPEVLRAFCSGTLMRWDLGDHNGVLRIEPGLVALHGKYSTCYPINSFGSSSRLLISSYVVHIHTYAHTYIHSLFICYLS